MKPQGPITQLLELSLLASLASSPPHPLDDIGAEGVCAYNHCALREGKAAVVGRVEGGGVNMEGYYSFLWTSCPFPRNISSELSQCWAHSIFSGNTGWPSH